MNDRPMFDKADGGLRRPEAATGMDQGLRVLSYLIGGVLVYGGLGWVGDHYLGTGFLLPIGIVAGAGLGIYTVIRRFGQVDDASLVQLAAARRRERAAGRPSRGPIMIDTTEGDR